MLLRKGNAGVIFISLPLAITFLLLYLVWFPAKGSIVILEEPDKMGFTMEFNAWSKKINVSYPYAKVICYRWKLIVKAEKLL